MSKRDSVVPEMRTRLQTNKYGKMTSAQWLDLVTQPIMSLLVLCLPLAIFLPRFSFFMIGWMLALAALLGIGIFVMRAYRYARAPIHFARFSAIASLSPLWSRIRPVRMLDEHEKQIKFNQRLCPMPRLEGGRTYIAYYLKDENISILLSIAPANHPEVNEWTPTKLFKRRFEQRQ